MCALRPTPKWPRTPGLFDAVAAPQIVLGRHVRLSRQWRQRVNDAVTEGMILDRLREQDVPPRAQRALIDKLDECGTDMCVPIVKRFLSAANNRTSASALGALRNLRSDLATQAIIDGLPTMNRVVLPQATFLLWRRQVLDAVPALVSLLSDRYDELDPGSKWALMWALGNMPDWRSVPVLTRGCSDDDRATRKVALRELERIRHAQHTS